jgi:hypothetical protein
MPKRPTRRGQSPELAPIDPRHNDLNEEQQQRLMLDGVAKLERLIEAQQSANSAVRLQRKALKSDGFSRTMVDYALWLRKTEGDEAAERMQDQIKIAQWLGKPLGFQPTLFDQAAAQ